MINIEGMKMNSLWFADDSIVLANSVEGTIKNIRQVRNISKTFGLELNEEKSAIIINKGSIGVGEIEGIRVVKETKYR